MYDVIEKLITHQGWARFSKLDYLSKKHLQDGLPKEDIKKLAVDEYELFTNKSFNSTWNLFQKIKSDINYMNV